MSAQQAVRRWIMTGAVTAITVTGALYGAGLKSQQELKLKKRELMETTPDEKIAQLEMARSDLVNRKTELERKLAQFNERRRERQNEGE